MRRKGQPSVHFSREDLKDGILERILRSSDEEMVRLVKEHGNPSRGFRCLMEQRQYPMVRGRIRAMLEARKEQGRKIFYNWS